MKSFIAITLAAAASAAAMPAPVPQAGTSSPQPFLGQALAEGTAIHQMFINANGLKFWIGKNTTTYCPEDSVAADACATANKNQTIFGYLNGESQLPLLTQVPGGQLAYVTAGDQTAGILAGELRFTPAHSGRTNGPALYDGFLNVYDAKLQFEGKDWFACPVDEFNTGYGIWAQSRVEASQAGEGCICFTWHVYQLANDVVKAWQYL
ncbi:uncharacterized protein MYCFIDRAFT_211999 [Pseudocercospora fijiensis CIRAD86]|uniref:Cell wall protein PhiA n=1 Tax=Pseudocercospora fijiensis (strain CIRAD86) TaxID=383855 RepID=M3ARZ0_PSEFD|nr:uncharacterized protein MYCFIDRAFT_211999 [Pseudocercospora fijiensis CIRAD86]EME80222.1 hypothetical protein MYCFIDRAFT_211999 [Pseudocercospora fijiensis CIRAD86]